MTLPRTLDPSSPASTDSPSAAPALLQNIQGYLADTLGLTTGGGTSQTGAAFSITTAGLVTVAQTPFTVPSMVQGTASQILNLNAAYSQMQLSVASTVIGSLTATGMILQKSFLEWPTGTTGVIGTQGPQTLLFRSGAATQIMSGSASGLYIPGQIQVGAGPFVVTTPTGLLDATKLTGAVPIGSLYGSGTATQVLFGLPPGFSTIIAPVLGAAPTSGFLLQSAGVQAAPAWVPPLCLYGSSRLTLANATQLVLGQGVLPLRVGTQWQLRTVVPSVIISLPTSPSLLTNTTHFVYAADSAGSTVLDVPTTTAHATDSAYGVEIKTGDSTRTLVGMARTNASGLFEADNGLQGVVSWYNRRTLGLVNTFSTDRSTTSATFTELNQEIRGNVLTWSDESVWVSITGTSDNTTANGQVSTAVGVDSTTVAQTGFESGGLSPAAGNQGIPIGIAGPIQGLSEGFHFFALLGATSGGTTGNWRTADSLANARLKTALLVGIRG